MDYYGVSPSSDFFAHYGVPGMQWGVRKDPEFFRKGVNSVAFQNAKRKLLKVEARQAAAHKSSAVKNHPKDTTGKYGKGNINLNQRKVVRNRDGSISTERSFSVNIDGKETLLPTVINGKVVDEDTAIDHYYRTGEHLGQFDTVEEAEEYADALHNRQDWYYNQHKKKSNGKSVKYGQKTKTATKIR